MIKFESYRESDPTLREARLFVQNNRDPGCECPCCGRLVKVYKRKLNSGMAASLIWMVRNFENGWIDVASKAPRYVLKSRELPKLKHWGLVEDKPNEENPEKRCAGFWRPTRKGALFAHRQINQPSHVFIVDNKVVGWSNQVVWIEQSLGAHFDYAELMGHQRV